MLRKEFNIRQKSYPIPIAVLISAANTYDCDIFIEYEQFKVNVKNYNEMKNGFDTHQPNQLFCFNGWDEAQAQQRITYLLTP